MKIEIKTIEVDSRSLSKNIFRQLQHHHYENPRCGVFDDEYFINGNLVIGRVNYPELIKQRNYHKDMILVLVFDEEEERLEITSICRRDIGDNDDLTECLDNVPQIFLKA